MDTMNIYAEWGSKVIFSNPTYGYKGDQELAKKHLTEGDIYTIQDIEISSFSSRVMLEEVPNVWFNTVLFGAA